MVNLCCFRPFRVFESREEEAFDTVWITDADLDMGLVVEAGVFVDGIAFYEDAADCVEGDFSGFDYFPMKSFNYVVI